MQITIKYPDDCTEYEAALYAQGCFTQCQHDYKRKEPTGKKDATAMLFRDDRKGLFYRTKTGYFLELIKKDEQE